jgi:phospholipase C
MIDEHQVHTLPQLSGYGCKEIGIVPVDVARNLPNPIPADFNPRPRTNPTKVATPSPSPSP